MRNGLIGTCLIADTTKANPIVLPGHRFVQSPFFSLCVGIFTLVDRPIFPFLERSASMTPRSVLLPRSSFSPRPRLEALPLADGEYGFRLRLGSRAAILFVPLRSMVSRTPMLNATSLVSFPTFLFSFSHSHRTWQVTHLDVSPRSIATPYLICISDRRIRQWYQKYADPF